MEDGQFICHQTSHAAASISAIFFFLHIFAMLFAEINTELLDKPDDRKCKSKYNFSLYLIYPSFLRQCLPHNPFRKQILPNRVKSGSLQQSTQAPLADVVPRFYVTFNYLFSNGLAPLRGNGAIFQPHPIDKARSLTELCRSSCEVYHIIMRQYIVPQSRPCGISGES